MSRLKTLTDRKIAIRPSEESQCSFDTCIRTALPLYRGEYCFWQLLDNDCDNCILFDRDAFEEQIGVLDE